MSTLLDRMVERDGRGASGAPLLVVKLAGDPVPKGRPRASIITPRGGGDPFIHFYTPKATEDYEAMLRARAIDAMRGRKVFDEALDVTCFAYFPVPQSWPEAKKEAARGGLVRPTSRPDWDNVAKAACDALNPFVNKRLNVRVPVVWRDDSVIVDSHVHKIFASKQPGLIIEIRSAGLPPIPWAPPA